MQAPDLGARSLVERTEISVLRDGVHVRAVGGDPDTVEDVTEEHRTPVGRARARVEGPQSRTRVDVGIGRRDENAAVDDQWIADLCAEIAGPQLAQGKREL